MTTPFRPLPTHQHGVILVVALIMLVILSLLGISAVRTIALEEKMSTAAYDRGLAFQAAEAALRMGEEDLLDRTTGLKPAASNGACNTTTLIGKAATGYISQTDIDCSADWPSTLSTADWVKASKEVSSGDYGAIPKTNVRYMIEYLSGDTPCEPRDPNSTNRFCHQFRVTAKAAPGGDRADVMLQSVYFTR